ncbi:protein phosphatase 1F isoform X2 [Amphiprion ocellaris]|uniref:protein phosphatase 1F isoform X2 n=1 Tax=Amphiprion ocellaris TaxID=80972 RepID=UPI0024117F04|nr:protein phosphatase 1F isoform X2 [Amphiprion ocellaris]
MEEETICFLERFVKEFPAALEESSSLPISPLSRKVSLEELHGETLELGLRLLASRSAPAGLSALLSHTALTQLLQNDLSSFHCPQEAEANQEEGETVLLLQSEAVQRLFLNKLIDVALQWYENLPKLSLSPSRVLHCSVHAIKNTRRKMEDKHLVLAEFNQLFGIQHLRSGSTGVAMLIQGQQLTVAWLGDSQAILVRKQQVVTLMEPHKPEREDEKQRIEDLGGCVTFMGCWRVNGTYAVSRAIGDFDQKPYVSGDADCSTVQLLGDEDYVLLACDGFFDAVKPSEVPYLVLDALQQACDPEGGTSFEQPEDAVGQRVAQQLVGHAKAAGSSDNITVMLIFLCSPLELLVQQSITETGQATQHFTSQDASQQ